MKGCPLRCIWCHNPESISFEKQIAFFENKCLSCLLCKGERNERTALICPSQAITLYGKEYTPEQLVNEVSVDVPFFKNSNGGVTLSGGECLSQPDFAIECAKLFKENGISVYIDTCGFVPQSTFERIMPYTDKFLYDIKAISPEAHKKCTGQENALILNNFKYLVESNANIEVRFPLVMNYNDSETEKIGSFLNSIGFKEKIKVLRYHSFSASRYTALGMKNTLPDTTTEFNDVENAVLKLQKMGLVAINGITDN
jgi:pyruvate formate lyase activating enzyme